ncbi:hypothetical protein Ae201684_002094 [Aphanomyces euteiches]|uniref:Uncharacterized protein n=1 Tax=Aphanomyces euteiches TaxID=100861 RepID=A0A6G0XR54_9STRA|nr:hypothetical protein Ae201684_002094 [Aphanomyces euteiches]KAH9132608.1 hypothetical protein AeRB84_021045 [Aphanomyces euteiches]KAH9145235.1 hypothetical protein AeRB84_010868 [Aphanomyces euteiches]KAH9147682.1 hypothetical protein AeRB84_008746 [Aphanomyces euteiches]KAH9147701.1 hypothetical protein AeRB84_008765 [Aphanomyces euteiches]
MLNLTLDNRNPLTMNPSEHVATVLDRLIMDMHFRVTLVDEQCHKLRSCLKTCSRQKEEQAKLSAERLAVETQEEQDALKRARSVRNAQAKQSRSKSSVNEKPSTKLPSPPSAPSTSSVKHHRLELPRAMQSQIQEVLDAKVTWETLRDAPPAAFRAKMNQILSQRDTTTNVQIPYREQLFRLEYAYARVLLVLEKCINSHQPDSQPTLARVFPIWFRLHKIKKLLDELNNELSNLMQRIPPPPQLSEATAERSARFLQAICPAYKASDVDNRPLVAAIKAQDTKWTPAMDTWLARLQNAWNVNEYGSTALQIGLEESCGALIPIVHELLQRDKVTKEEVMDGLMVLRLLHSITCCDGLLMRSFVSS